MTRYHPLITAALARQRALDLLRERTATADRGPAGSVSRQHRTPRRRPLWWVQVAARVSRAVTT